MENASTWEDVRATSWSAKKCEILARPATIPRARATETGPKGWSQSDVAARTSLGIATIKRLEAGTTVQTLANDQLLRNVLRVASSSEIEFVVRNKECVQSPAPRASDFLFGAYLHQGAS